MEDGSLSCTLRSDKRNIPVDYKRERDEFVSTGSGDERERERERLLSRILFVYASGNE